MPHCFCGASYTATMTTDHKTQQTIYVVQYHEYGLPVEPDVYLDQSLAARDYGKLVELLGPTTPESDLEFVPGKACQAHDRVGEQDVFAWTLGFTDH